MTETENKNTLTFASVREARFVFFLVFVGVLSLTYGFFFAIDFLPEKPTTQSEALESVREATVESGMESTETLSDSDNSSVPSADEGNVSVRDESALEAIDRDESSVSANGNRELPTPVALSSDDIYPTRIVFDSLDGRTVSVENPTSRDIAILDTALLKGVVRHPDSGDFERIGTIVLFGHSSYLPNVMNKNFQAFNGIQKLAWGDIIRLESESREYVYRVDRVYEASASDASAEVKVEAGKRKLTLVTCDSFGSKSDRFIVEASLIEESDLKG